MNPASKQLVAGGVDVLDGESNLVARLVVLRIVGLSDQLERHSGAEIELHPVVSLVGFAQTKNLAVEMPLLIQVGAYHAYPSREL